ncbi:MAG: tetratricopeptide repeat protein [Bacteriovoracaceae bacterium]
MKYIGFALLLLFSFTSSFAEGSSLEEIEEAFKLGEHNKVVSLGEAFVGNRKDTGIANYYTGLSYNRLAQFSKAKLYLSKAVKAKVEFEDVYFELGQSFYADNDMEKSARAFYESVKRKFKVVSSKYYIAHISQILEKWKTAKKFYKRLLKEKEADDKIKQVARFQLGEVNLSFITDKNLEDARTQIKAHVLPHLEKSINVNPELPLAKVIDQRKKELMKKYALDPKFLSNGAPAPSKYTLSFSEKFKYDDNVTYSAELPTSTGTLKDSYIFNTTLTSGYNYIYDQKYVFNPNLTIDHTRHSDDVNATVFQNNGYSLTGGLSNTIPFKFKGRPGNFKYNYSYKYAARDRLQIKENKFSGRTQTHALSTSLPYFSKGPTTLSLSLADFNTYDPNLDSQTLSFSTTQIMIFPNMTMLILLFSYSDVAVEDTSNSTSSMTMRADYLILNRIPTYTFQVGCGYTMTDTKEQSDTRGTETTLAPSFKVSKKFNKKLSLSYKFDYSKKDSESESSAYTKNVSTFELKYNF